MVSLETNYLTTYWSDLHQIFRIDSRIGVDQSSDICSGIEQGRCYGNHLISGRFGDIVIFDLHSCSCKFVSRVSGEAGR